MPRYQFNRQAGPALLDRLIAAGLPPTLTVEPGPTTFITCTPEEYDAVASVVAAYDQAALDAQDAQDRQADTDAGQQVRAALTDLNAARDLLAGAGALTLAQAKPILTLLVRVQLAQLRLLVRRGVV